MAEQTTQPTGAQDMSAEEAERFSSVFLRDGDRIGVTKSDDPFGIREFKLKEPLDIGAPKVSRIQENVVMGAGAGGTQTRGEATEEQRVSATLGGRMFGVQTDIQRDMLTRQQELKEQASIRQLTPAEQNELRSLSVSTQFGAGSQPSGATLPGELSGEEKLQKLLTAGLAGEGRTLGDTITGGVPRTTAEAFAQKTDFVFDIGKFTQGPTETSTEFELRKALATTVKAEEALAQSLSVSEALKVADTLRQETAATTGKVGTTDHISNFIKAQKKTQDTIEENRQKAIVSMERSKNADIQDEFNRTKGKISVANPETRKQLEKNLLDQITARHDKNFEDNKKTLEGKYDDLKEKTGKTFDSNLSKVKGATVADRKAIEKQTWINQQQSKDPTLSTAFLSSKYDALNRYDGKGIKEKQLGAKLDAILEGPEDDVTKFESLYTAAGQDLDESFNTFKSRFGSAQAKKIRDQFLSDKGWDERAIANKSVSDDVVALFSGTDTEATDVANFVKNAQSAGLSDRFINSQLNAITTSATADDDVKNEARGQIKDLGFKEVGVDDEVTFKGLPKTQKDAVLQIGNMIYGGKISDQETRNVVDVITDPGNQGKTRFEIIADVLGFTPEKNIEVGDSLLDVLRQNVSEGGTLRDFDLLGLSDLLNKKDPSLAVRRVENIAMKKAKAGEGNDFFSESFARRTVKKVKELGDITEEVKAIGKEPFGEFEGTLEEWFGRFKGKEATKVKAAVTDALSEMRVRLLGSAVTPSESEWLEPLIPKLGDDPENFLIKLERLKQGPLTNLNSVRTTYGLPEISEDQLLDQKLRKDLYDIPADTLDTEGVAPEMELKPLGEMTDEEILNLSDKDKQRLRQRIKSAPIEGVPTTLGAQTETRPIRNKNPINIKSGGIGDEFAQKDAEGNIMKDDQGHLVFETAEAGVKAGKADLKAKVTGNSPAARARLGKNIETLAELGKVFAEDPNWANGVARILGLEIGAKVADIDFDELFRAVSRQEGGGKLLASL